MGLAAAGKQAAYGLAQGLNKTMIDVQKANRDALPTQFTVRRKDWLAKSFKISKFAKKNDHLVRMEISPPGAPQKADILSKFQEGGVKEPTGKTIAVPVDVRRGGTGVISPGNRPRALINAGKAFVVRSRTTGKGVIKQRVGKGKRARVIVDYGLTLKAKIPKRLEFFETFRSVVKSTLRRNIENEIQNALRTAR
jgi:hypothetical protein